MGWRCPHSGWVLSFSFAGLETPSQTRPMARLLHDSRSNQVDSDDGVRAETWAQHLLRNTTVVVTGLSWCVLQEQPEETISG